LIEWTRPLFRAERPAAAKLREALCWMSDIGSHDHPEFRAEQAFLRVLRQPGLGLDHPSRAFLALGVAGRYDAGPDANFLRPARLLLDSESANRAELLGIALGLAYTLSAGTRNLLAGTWLRIEGSQLVLHLRLNSGVFAGEAVIRRLERLAQAMGLAASAVEDLEEAAAE
jgi:exopolyphosphatase / guanosine-5'-triphosphate,3'-diphosphate pyrophosphatase